MAQKAGAAIFSMLMLTACGVGGDEDVTEQDPNPLAMTCTDAFKVTGTFTASTARPVEVEGCWPAGTWSFSLSLDPTDEQILDITGDKLPDRCGQVAGTSPATFEPNYSFTVTRTDDGDGFVDGYAMNGGGLAAQCTQPGKCVYRLKVTEGGGLECEGGLEIYSADRTEHWNLKPNQATGNPALSGFGEYTKFTVAQNPS